MSERPSPRRAPPDHRGRSREPSRENDRSFGQFGLASRSPRATRSPSRSWPSVTALVVGGLINAFTNTTVLHAWGNLFSAPGHAFAQAWDTAIGAYVALFEGSIFNPHTVSALFQQASISTAIHDGYLSAVFAPIVRDVRPGHPADPGWARGGAAVPGRPVQHRRAGPVHRRRHPRHLRGLRGQPAARHPRDRLRARRLRRRRGDRLDPRRAQGADRRARGDRDDHAQLHHGLLPRLPARLPLPDAGTGDRQPDHQGHRRRRAPAAAVRLAPADQCGLPGRAGLRGSASGGC